MTKREQYELTFYKEKRGLYLYYDCRRDKLPPTKNNYLALLLSVLQDHEEIDDIIENIDGALNGTIYDNEPVSDSPVPASL